jgi:hypothetical protein
MITKLGSLGGILILSFKDRQRIKAEDALRAPVIRSRKGLWSVIAYSSVIGTVGAVTAVISLIITAYINFHENRAILVTIAPKPPPVLSAPTRDRLLAFSPVISNGGNQTEVVLSVCIAVGFSGPADNRHQIRGTLAGPLVLKGGEAQVVPVTFAKVADLPKEDDVYVRVVAFSPRDGITAVDIPVIHMSLASQGGDNSKPEAVQYTETLSANYHDGPIDIFSFPQSHFPYSGPSSSETQIELPSFVVAPNPK